MERVITIKDPHEIPAHFFWSSSIILNSIKYRVLLKNVGEIIFSSDSKNVG